MRLTLLVTDEGNLWSFHINSSLKIHPMKAVDYFPLPVLGDRVCITGHGKLEGCVRNIARPFVMVSSDLFMYLFVRCARSVQLGHRPRGKEHLYTCGEIKTSGPHLTKMHLFASMKACSSDSKDRIINGREVSISGGKPILNPWSSDMERSSGILNSSCTWAKRTR